MSLSAGILVKSRFLFTLFFFFFSCRPKSADIFWLKLELDLIKSPNRALQMQASRAVICSKGLKGVDVSTSIEKAKAIFSRPLGS